MFAYGDCCLSAVAAWATGSYWLVRAIGAPDFGGRLDGLLVPVTKMADCMTRGSSDVSFFCRCRLIAVEMKLSRADFLSGLRSGQFERYASAPAIAGLYVVAPDTVCKAKELPKNIGFLRLVHGCPTTVRCHRHPQLRDVTPDADVLWRILFKTYAQITAYYCEETAQQERRLRRALDYVGSRVFPLIRDGIADGHGR